MPFKMSGLLLVAILNGLLSEASPLFSTLNNTLLERRNECTPCGYYGTACCAWGEVCYTDPSNNQASCSIAAPAPTQAPNPEDCDSCGGSGSWVYWTSTFTSTDLVTYRKTYSSWVGHAATTTYTPPKTTAQAAICDLAAGECSCGPICCASWQYCKVEGQCEERGGGGYTQPPPDYQSYTAPLRPTSLATQTITTTVRPTTTVEFEPAVQTGNVTIASSSGGGGLSGGAIAGIVIGVIAGIIILILICLCLCAGAAASSILAFFGIGRKKERRREEVEYYHRHGSRADGRTWYGSGGRPPPPKKKKSSGIGFGGILAGLAAFAAALSFKRSRDRKRDEKSSYTGSSYTYSDSSYSSSDRRTRDTRRSRR